MFKKVLIVSVFVAIVGGSLAGSKKTDAEILTKVGRTATEQVVAVLPERAKVAGPLAKVRLIEWGGLDDKVRTRLQTDAALDRANLSVNADAVTGTVKLSGKLDTTAQRDRAVQLAQTTTGVKVVEHEIAVPDGK